MNNEIFDFEKLGNEIFDILELEEEEPGVISEESFRERLESMTDLEHLRLLDELVYRGVYPAEKRDEWFKKAVELGKKQNELKKMEQHIWQLEKEHMQLRKEYFQVTGKLPDEPEG